MACRAAPTLDEEAIKEVTEKHGVPTPIVKIDNKVDNWATVLSVGFGNELGELLDTVCRNTRELIPTCSSRQLHRTCLLIPVLRFNSGHLGKSPP